MPVKRAERFVITSGASFGEGIGGSRFRRNDAGGVEITDLANTPAARCGFASGRCRGGYCSLDVVSFLRL